MLLLAQDLLYLRLLLPALQEEIFEVGSEGMLVQDLANKLACNSGDVLKALFMKGIMAQVNQVLHSPSLILPDASVPVTVIYLDDLDQ